MNTTLDVVTLGEALLLLAADEPGPLEQVRRFRKGSAGAETNVAIGLARLGLEVGWQSRLGADSMARYLVAEIGSAGVDCSHVVCDAAQRTGFMFKGRVDDGSDPPTEYHRTGSAASRLRPADLDADWLAGARLLHVTGVFPALSASTLQTTREAMAIMRSRGRLVSFDPNLRPALWPSRQTMIQTLNGLAEGADWVLPGLDEGRLLSGCDTPERIAAFYRERGAQAVVVKLGAAGAYIDGVDAAGDGASIRGYVPAVPAARVVDTVGAGDAFAVGLISALLERRSLADAARRGAWIGARAVQVRGDTEGLPTRAELDTAGV